MGWHNNIQMKTTLRAILIAGALIVVNAPEAMSQPAGGKTTGGVTTNPTSKPKPPTTKPTVGSSSRITKATSTAPASIDGKWWTSGNSFGDSEVVFTQNGASVSGVIRYADGRTGTVNGTMVGKRLQMSWSNSSGDGGTGWLELSWNNFLGGAWRNQTVRDGSWTLMRVEGLWCFGGSRNRIRTVTHNARGDLFMVTEDGSRDGGHMEGPWLFLESDGMTIKGDMDFRANRVNWSSGFFWTWCGRK